MPFRFESTTQAVAVLVRLTPTRRMSYMRMLKLLYLADRRMLEQTGVPITFDRAVAMDHGPVLSETYSLIKGEHLLAPQWDEFFAKEDYHISLVGDPGRGQLSRRAISILHSVSEEVAHLNDWALVKHLHNTLPEWQKNKPQPKSSNPISLRDILEALDIKNGDADCIEEEIDAIRKIDRIQSSV